MVEGIFGFRFCCLAIPLLPPTLLLISARDRDSESWFLILA
jgi:hypothetical protein